MRRAERERVEPELLELPGLGLGSVSGAGPGAGGERERGRGKGREEGRTCWISSWSCVIRSI